MEKIYYDIVEEFVKDFEKRTKRIVHEFIYHRQS